MSSSSSYTHPPTDTDIVSVSALHLTATVGPDHWHRTRPQPVHLTVHLHLTPSYLNTPGQSDNVTDSLHYGHLVKAVETRVGKRSELASTHEEKEEDRGYASARALVEDVTDAAFEFVRDAMGRAGQTRGAMEAMIHAVRVVLELPKQILLARGFEIDLVTRASDWLSRSARGSGSGLGSGSGSTAGAVVRVRDLVLPVLIGVNPPERLAKQHVITHLTFFEAPHTNITDVPGPEGAPAPEAMMEIDYPSIVQQIATASHHTRSLVSFVPTDIDTLTGRSSLGVSHARKTRP